MIKKSEKLKNRFTSVNNILFHVERVKTNSGEEIKFTLEHIGYITYLSSLPDNWSLNSKHIMNFLGFGEEKYYRIIKDLSQFGFILPIEQQRVGGKFANSACYTWSDEPEFLPSGNVLVFKPSAADCVNPEILMKYGESDSILPYPGQPDTVEPNTGNPGYINKYSNKEINKRIPIVPLKEDEDAIYFEYLEILNRLRGTKFRTVTSKTKSQIDFLKKLGATTQDLETAIKNVMDEQWSIENGHKYITLEYITRADKFEKYTNVRAGAKKQLTMTEIIAQQLNSGT